jgi:hypothetical protein
MLTKKRRSQKLSYGKEKNDELHFSQVFFFEEKEKFFLLLFSLYFPLYRLFSFA